MASLRNRNGTYYASFCDADRSPNEKRVSLKTKDKSTARSLLAKFERLWLTGEADPWLDDLHEAVRPDTIAEELTVGESFERFITSRRAMNCTANTIRTYTVIRRSLLDHLDGNPLLHRLAARDLRGYVLAPRLSVATQRKRYGQLNAFLNWSREKNYLQRDPLDDITKPKASKRLPVPVERDDLVAVCEAMKEHYRSHRRSGAMQQGLFLWRISAFWFAFLTGLRRSEIARLRWQDVDFERQAIFLRKQKNRNQQWLPISDKAAHLLRRLGRPDDEKQFVFRSAGFMATERNQQSFGNNLSRTWRKFRRKANLSEAKDFHALRKGFCSQLAKSGASAVVIKRAARHADIQTSMIYVALHDDSIRSELDAAF